MNDHTDRAQAAVTGGGGRVNRRGFMQFLGVGAAASAGSLGLAGTAAADGTTLTVEQRQMVLTIARTGAVFPVPFRDHGEPGPAVNRATDPRLQNAIARTTPERISQTQAAVAAITAKKINSGIQDEMLKALAELYGSSNSHDRVAVTATVALAITTIASVYDPNDDGAAHLWLNGLRLLNERNYFTRTR
ncbi:hypothetical protein ACIA5G_39510 [Amycolatopsis sp. NPDC051758]|uniref:hypothetical protein n=1 Tax=Amycolatopsis sp. NPDC051758 TaxID=3363935 RepID=UPI00379C2C2F